MLFNILFAFIIVLSIPTMKSEAEITIPIKERIKLLKFKLAKDLKRTSLHDGTTIVNENIDYVAVDAITPISRDDERIKDQLYMLPLLKTRKVTSTTIKPWDKEPEEKIFDDIDGKIIVLKNGRQDRSTEESSKSFKGNKKHGNSKVSSKGEETNKGNDNGSDELISKTVEKKIKKLLKIKRKVKTKKSKIKAKKFKRNKKRDKVKGKKKVNDSSERNKPNNMGRAFEKNEQTDNKSEENEEKGESSEKEKISRRLITEEMMNAPIQGVHCQRVITPYLIGIKKSFDDPKHVTSTDRGVIRFLDLVQLNVTGYTKEDIYAVLYQISETQVRLFQWDIPAIRNLFIAIAGDGQRHTFKSLKSGLRKKFNMWHLDLHWNTTTLLKDTLMFRPYCLDNRDGGSTLSSRVSRFIKSTTPTTNDCDD